MTYGARAALAAVVAAAGLALPAAPSRAESCVQVLVDYTSPGRACAGGAGTSAAEVLAARARALGRPAPRYSNSGFLCAIDGNPGTGCGEEAGQPYWSFWYWRHGAWVYSNVGVHSFGVADGDGDGHLDPLGFRYHPPKEKAPPRAQPVFAAPSTKPATQPPATQPPTAAPGPGATRPAARPTTAGPGTRTPGAAGTSAPSTAPATAAVNAAAGATAVPAPSTSSEEVREDVPAPVAARRARHVPYGTVLGGALALALLAAAALRARKPGAR